MTIFLDANDEYWILARTRAELTETLLSMIDNDAHLLRLAAACLGCEEESVMWVEMKRKTVSIESATYHYQERFR